MNLFQMFLVGYGILALGHLAFQLFLSHWDHIRQKKELRTKKRSEYNPSVSVVLPVYNEEPKIIESVIDYILKQKVDDMELLVIDDGSPNREELISKVYSRYENQKNVRIFLPEENRGKRMVQKIGFDAATKEVIVTIDSDTLMLDEHAIALLVKDLSDETIGGVTGDVRVANDRETWLSRLINYRYWTAFHQERAAQSFFNVVMCCSGPFAAYRKDVIDTVKEQYVSQMFLGKECTFGDDRHLTNLVLALGYKVKFNEFAQVWTYVPTTVRNYVKQQVRWNKSFYREMLWTIRFAHKHNPYMLYDMVMQFVLPFLLVVSLLSMDYQIITQGDVWHFVNYIAMIMIIGLVRALYGFIRTKEVGFLLFVLYGFMHVLILIPVRFYALFTINRTGWGTRDLSAKTE